jgi:hypothetical protein
MFTAFGVKQAANPDYFRQTAWRLLDPRPSLSIIQQSIQLSKIGIRQIGGPGFALQPKRVTYLP